jgi:hypothetical protein
VESLALAKRVRLWPEAFNSPQYASEFFSRSECVRDRYRLQLRYVFTRTGQSGQSSNLKGWKVLKTYSVKVLMRHNSIYPLHGAYHSAQLVHRGMTRVSQTSLVNFVYGVRRRSVGRSPTCLMRSGLTPWNSRGRQIALPQFLPTREPAPSRPPTARFASRTPNWRCNQHSIPLDPLPT